MKITLSILSMFLIAAAPTIYGFTVTGADGSSISFNQFEGKKILLVNIATGSPRVNQLQELQQLQNQYADSLVVIGFPSNSFGQESKSNEELVKYLNALSVTYRIALKGEVSGENAQPLYKWLTDHSKNGVTNSIVKEDFQKYLIDTRGELMGIFAGSVSPLDNQVIASINYHN